MLDRFKFSVCRKSLPTYDKIIPNLKLKFLVDFLSELRVQQWWYRDQLSFLPYSNIISLGQYIPSLLKKHSDYPHGNCFPSLWSMQKISHNFSYCIVLGVSHYFFIFLGVIHKWCKINLIKKFIELVFRIIWMCLL